MNLLNLQVGNRQCYKCLEVKSIYLFYKDKHSSEGRGYKCIDCCKKSREENTERDKEYRKNNRDKYRKGFEKWLSKNREQFNANQKTAYAIRSGKLKRLPCAVCGDEKTQAHHQDYSKPFDIFWLCKKHHGDRHRLGFIPNI